MHRPNRTHNTRDCFELKQCTKHVKADVSCGRADKVTCKDLNAFINTKVTAALNKTKKNQKKKEAKRLTTAVMKRNALAAASNNDSESNTSCDPSKDSDSNDK
eukprot:5595207-Ditylum_brightwellii.AAC.2